MLSLCASPLAKGYFRRAIVQSGGFIQASDRKTEEEAGLKFAQRVGVDSIAGLRAKPAAEIQRIAIPSSRWDSAQRVQVSPVRRWLLSDHCPARRFSGRSGKYPFAACRFECQRRHDTRTHSGYRSTTEEPDRGQVRSPRRKNTSRSTRCTPTRKRGKRPIEAVRDYMAGTALEVATVENKHQTYVYYFDRHPPGHDSDRYGAYHSAELVYVFNNLDSVKRPWTETDRKLGRHHVELLGQLRQNWRSQWDRPSPLAGLWHNVRARPRAGHAGKTGLSSSDGTIERTKTERIRLDVLTSQIDDSSQLNSFQYMLNLMLVLPPKYCRDEL